MAFSAKFLTHEELENLVNSMKELNNKAMDVINLMFSMDQNLSSSKKKIKANVTGTNLYFSCQLSKSSFSKNFL